MVSFDIITPNTVLLNEVTQLFGVDGTELICSERDNEKLWRLESKLDTEKELFNHIRSIFNVKAIDNLSKQDNDYRKFLSIGVMSDMASCSIQVPVDIMEMLSKLKVILEITYYPTLEDE